MDIYSDGVFVAVSGAVEGILFRVTEASKIAHCSFEFDVRGIFSLPFLASLNSVSTMECAFPIVPESNMATAVSIDMLEFSAAVAAGADEMCGVVLAKDGQGLFEFVLLDVAVAGEVFAGRGSGY